MVAAVGAPVEPGAAPQRLRLDPEKFTQWADSEAEPVDGLGDKAIYQAKDQLGGGGKAFALAVLHHGERVFVLEHHVKGADGSEAGTTLDKLRPLAAKIVERH